MGKIAAIAVLALLTCGTGYSDTVSWGSVTLSASGGPFLAGSTITTSGTQWILNLPNFFQSDFAPIAGEVSLVVNADTVDPSIFGVTFKYFGAFDTTNGFPSVHYEQTASGSPGESGDFSTPSFSSFLAVSATNHLELGTTIDLNDMGGSVAINQIEFDLEVVPEPSSLRLVIMLTTGLALALALRFRRRSN
jgi:hypothetical protein